MMMLVTCELVVVAVAHQPVQSLLYCDGGSPVAGLKSGHTLQVGAKVQ